MGVMQRRKGARTERWVVQELQYNDIACERVPLSGAMHYQGNGGDIDIYTGDIHLQAEVKSRKKSMWKTLVNWLSGSDVLIMKENSKDPYVFMSMKIFIKLLKTRVDLNVQKLKEAERIFQHFEEEGIKRTKLCGGGQDLELNQARKVIIRTLDKANWTHTEIANLLNRDRSTISKALGGANNNEDKSKEN